MMWQITFLLICMIFSKDAAGLTCYSCNPVNCDRFTQQSCPWGSDYCLTATAFIADNSFTMKSCTVKQVCDLAQSLPGIDMKDVKCCEENLCNGAERFTLSFLIMFTPLLPLIFFY